MRGSGWFLAFVVLTVTLCVAGEPEPAKPETDPWVGKSRDEVIAEWGKPVKTKSKGDAEILIYEIDVFMGEFYNTDDEYSTDISLSKKGENGKRKVELDTEGVTQAPIYKKMRFKFFLDSTDHVTKTDFPEKAKSYTPPK
jgi:hypothetical protein